MPGRARPNFILFITDQHRADFLGCYRHPVVRTPHIDSIAARGVTFDKFHVASPVCMPNRASLMTGRMPSVHGVRSNGIPLSRDAVTFVDLLRDAGYATALIGKSHLQNFTGNPPMAKPPTPLPGYRAPTPEHEQALRRRLSGPAYVNELPEHWRAPDAAVATPFYGYGHVELVAGHGDDVGGDYRRWLLARDPDALRLLGPKNALPHDYVCPQAHRTAIPAELYVTSYIGERAAGWVSSRPADTPFFATVSFPDPHHPFNPPGKYWDMYKPSDFPAPAALARNDWTPPPHVAAVLEARDSGRANLSGMRTIGCTAREAQEARALTAGMITCVDDAIGVVLDALRANGQIDNTVLIFTTDHGDHLGDHRLLLKGAEHYQSIVHVPFIWAEPADAKPARRTGALGSTMDIPATVLDRAKVAPYAGLQGKSLMPTIETGAAVQDSLLIQYEHQMAAPAGLGTGRVHTVVDDRWRLSIFDGAAFGELYDLANDPGEFENLWDSAAHATVRARLTEEIARLEIAYVDTVPLPTHQA
jgi:arylsulfatase A-like enzyme